MVSWFVVEEILGQWVVSPRYNTTGAREILHRLAAELGLKQWTGECSYICGTHEDAHALALMAGAEVR